jgi:hypothetical protein
MYVCGVSKDDLFKDIIDTQWSEFSEKGSTSQGDKPSVPFASGDQVYNEGDVIQLTDCIYIKATTVLYYSMGKSPARGNSSMMPAAALGGFTSPLRAADTPSLSAGKGGMSVGVMGESLVARKIGDILFVLNKSRLLLATPEDDGVTAIIRTVAPIMHTDVSIDSTAKRSLKLLVRSCDPVSLMSRVGCDSADLAAIMEPTSSNAAQSSAAQGNQGGMTLITATSSISAISTPSTVNVVSRQQMSKQSPCALQIRMQSTLWQTSITFENVEDCAAAARHVEISRYLFTSSVWCD